jgi:hypothetical protein
VQLPDLLLEIDAQCNYSEALLGHRAETGAELLALYAALLAHGTDIDAKSVAAMIPGLDTAWVSVAMRALETHGRLRRANERVVEFQGRVPLAAHWGDGPKGSADMMSLEATRHLWSARTDPRRRTYAAGIYTHVLNSWGIVYDQPIVLNERQAGVAIEGVERHNRSDDRIRLSLLAVDTHGYTNGAMAVANLLGFDLCPPPSRSRRAQVVLAARLRRARRHRARDGQAPVAQGDLHRLGRTAASGRVHPNRQDRR